jgi:hypothetical protein
MFKLDLVLSFFFLKHTKYLKYFVGICKGPSFGILINVLLWKIQRFYVLWWFFNIVFLLRYKVYLSAIACPLMWQTSLNNEAPSLDLLMLFCENESNPPLNQTLPLKKSPTFFLKLFQNTTITKRSKLD